MQVIRTARTQQPFTVIPLQQNLVKDYKQSLLASMPASFKDDTKHKVAFQDVKVFHYSKRHKGQVWVKYSMSETEAWKKVQILKRGSRLNLPPAQAYTRRLAVKEAKAKDLRRIAEKYLPQQYKDYYINLHTTSLSYDSESDSD